MSLRDNIKAYLDLTIGTCAALCERVIAFLCFHLHGKIIVSLHKLQIRECKNQSSLEMNIITTLYSFGRIVKSVKETMFAFCACARVGVGVYDKDAVTLRRLKRKSTQIY